MANKIPYSYSIVSCDQQRNINQGILPNVNCATYLVKWKNYSKTSLSFWDKVLTETIDYEFISSRKLYLVGAAYSLGQCS